MTDPIHPENEYLRELPESVPPPRHDVFQNNLADANFHQTNPGSRKVSDEKGSKSGAETVGDLVAWAGFIAGAILSSVILTYLFQADGLVRIVGLVVGGGGCGWLAEKAYGMVTKNQSAKNSDRKERGPD